MNKKLLLVLIISVMAKSWLAAQVDTIPDLIISEERMDNRSWSYIELTNMEDSTLDLSQFIIQSPWNGDDGIFYFAPSTMLAPKESYVLTNTYEGDATNWVEMQKIADQLVYVEEPGIPGDSISVGEYILQTWNGKYTSLLWYRSSETDSMIIDCFNWNKDDGGSALKTNVDVAGVAMATANNTLIRKLSVTEGNLGDWEYSRGTNADESEWLLAELPTYNQVIPFATVGNHGEDYQIVATSANPDVVIDLDNGTLTVPWGIYRGDSIIRELNLGEGVAWTLDEYAVFEDSVHNILRTGDTLQLKSFGETMQVKDLVITVNPPATDMNKAFPLRSIGLIDPDFPELGVEIKGTRYYITDGMPTIDTIGNVPFACRVDTMLNYIEWASNANAEILWKDGNVRVDLMNGDILEVTAENGSKKQYYIDVLDYNMSDDVDLSAITWPDITTEDIMYDLNWITDTVPGFVPSKTIYTIKLRYGSKVPALKAYPQDLNAKISYEPAVSLKGGLEERTTVITVTSESDTLTKKYSVIFELEIPDEKRQKFFAEPLFTGFMQKAYVDGQVLEIGNPGTEPLDLSQYLITAGSNQDALTTLTKTLDSAHRYNMYVPGYRLADDANVWDGVGYRKLMNIDATVNPIIAPGSGFLIGQGTPSKLYDKTGLLAFPDDYEITFPYVTHDPNRWGLHFNNDEAIGGRNASIVFYLWKINDTENDSIYNGWKAIGDPDNVTLLDAFGLPDGNWYDVAGYSGAVNQKAGNAFRKPSIYKPNPSYVLSASDNPEDSEWILLDPKVVNIPNDIVARFGNHQFDPVTAYISTVSSLTYIVDDGYEGKLGITGISNGETVQQFYDQLIIADAAMDLRVKNSTDGAPRDLADPIAQGDTLVVISADGVNTTKYELDLTPLNSNTKLVPSDGSALTVADGVVSGFDQGATLESVFAGVKAESDLSILMIIDPDGALVPLKELDSDGEYQAVLASSDIMFEVTAQNGDKAQYQLKPNSEVGDAFVLSYIYEVDNDNFVITGLYGGTAVSSFMANIIPAEGATVKIVDKADYDRTLGNLAYDDLLVVVSSDGSKTVTYVLNFVEEINTQPSLTVASDNIEVEVGIATSVSVTAEDDGLPAPPGALSYTWSVSSGEATNVTIANPNQATTDVTFSASGSYVLQVLVTDGELEATATVNVSVIVGIETVSSVFKMYPNPADDKVILEFMDRGSQIPIVSIYNITGKTVYKGIAENSTKIIDVSSMDNGLYIVEIYTGVQTITKKLSIINK